MSARRRRRDASDLVRVIGLVGGVGAGKSTVAAVLASMGCIVSDSDEQGRHALARPEVLEEIVGWWGERVRTPGKQPDRHEIARIVFSDPEERLRLEGLIHPLIRESRETLVDRAQKSGCRAVIIDAPLLFEAGLDAECDAVIYVHAPLKLRLKRVRDSRGWRRAELDRREKAQLPLDEKRRRSDYVVVNDGPPEELRARLRDVLAKILDPRTD